MSEIHCKIQKDIFYDCDNPAVRGARDRIIVLPKRIIKDYDLHDDSPDPNPLIIEDINRILAEGGTEYIGKGYQYVGSGKILGPREEMQIDDYGQGYNHEIEFHVEGTTPEKKLELYRLGKEEAGVVIILQSNFKDSTGKSEYQVLGRDVGLKIKEKEDEGGKNTYRLLLGSEEENFEPFPTSNFWKIDKATTDTAVAALLELTV